MALSAGDPFSLRQKPKRNQAVPGNPRLKIIGEGVANHFGSTLAVGGELWASGFSWRISHFFSK